MCVVCVCVCDVLRDGYDVFEYCVRPSLQALCMGGCECECVHEIDPERYIIPEQRIALCISALHSPVLTLPGCLLCAFLRKPIFRANIECITYITIPKRLPFFLLLRTYFIYLLYRNYISPAQSARWNERRIVCVCCVLCVVHVRLCYMHFCAMCNATPEWHRQNAVVVRIVRAHSSTHTTVIHSVDIRNNTQWSDICWPFMG